jgi:hypothetical protein
MSSVCSCGVEFNSTPEFLEASGGKCPNCLIIAGLAPAACDNCGRGFVWSPRSFRAMGLSLRVPKRCPMCNDERQHRPAVVLERRELWGATVRLGETAACLFQHAEVWRASERDIPGWRLTLRGKMFGADWSGRIDVYFQVDPKSLRPGQVVSLSHMESRSRVWVQKWTKQTMEHGEVSGYARCKPTDEGANEREEAGQYVTILPAPEGVEPVGTLVWAQAYSKVTLKGFGRQYAARLEGTPLWQMSVKGAARSGRFNTDARLAVVEEGNPLIHVHREDGEEERSEVLS